MSKCIKCGRELNTGETLEIYSGMCGKCYEEQYDKFVKKIDGKYLFGVIEKPLRQQIDQLKQQLAEKDKEIGRLKVFEKVYYFNQLQASQEDIQQFQQLANQSAVNINHIVITELEKIKEKISKLPITDILDTDYGGFKKIYQTDAMRIIDQQINELKGE